MVQEHEVYLKSVERNDIEMLHRWLNLPETFEPYDSAVTVTFERVREKWERGGFITTWLIMHQERAIGFCNFVPQPWEDWIAVIGVTIAEVGARGQGIGTLVHKQLVKGIFGKYENIHKIEALTDVGNQAEQRALEKSGFLCEGTLRRKNKIHGEFRDMKLYGILRP